MDAAAYKTKDNLMIQAEDFRRPYCVNIYDKVPFYLDVVLWYLFDLDENVPLLCVAESLEPNKMSNDTLQDILKTKFCVETLIRDSREILEYEKISFEEFTSKYHEIEGSSIDG